jgi:hypothetical protein
MNGNASNCANAAPITEGELQDNLYVLLFNCVVLFTFLVAAEMAWEMLATMPFIGDYITVYPAADAVEPVARGAFYISNMTGFYMFLFTACGGYKECMRWNKGHSLLGGKISATNLISAAGSLTQSGSPSGQSPQDEPVTTSQLFLFKHKEHVTLFWIIYSFIAIALFKCHLIDAIPPNLLTMTGIFVLVMCGTNGSREGHHHKYGKTAENREKGIENRETNSVNVTVEEEPLSAAYARLRSTNHPEPQPIPLAYTKPVLTAEPPANTGPQENSEVVGSQHKNARVSEVHKQIVLKYLETTEWINCAECQKLTGLSDSQSNRLLNSMVDDGLLVSEGTTKDKRYRLKRRNKPPNLTQKV